ncbi:MAG TPA: AtpZ/AtpI family protein [Saprospiraceae bacterium]|nr:AtpZ/AtpI family protein [Saprospiraceae bacterium]
MQHPGEIPVNDVLIIKPSSSNKYLKYSGLAFQMFVLLGVGAWLGQKVDQWLNTSDPYFTILFILAFTGAFFYRLIKELNRKDEH